jgi:hypothetical protein
MLTCDKHTRGSHEAAACEMPLVPACSHHPLRSPGPHHIGASSTWVRGDEGQTASIFRSSVSYKYSIPLYIRFWVLIGYHPNDVLVYTIESSRVMTHNPIAGPLVPEPFFFPQTRPGPPSRGNALMGDIFVQNLQFLRTSAVLLLPYDRWRIVWRGSRTRCGIGTEDGKYCRCGQGKKIIEAIPRKFHGGAFPGQDRDHQTTVDHSWMQWCVSSFLFTLEYE